MVMETRLARLAAMSLSSQNPLPRRRLLDLTGDELVVKGFLAAIKENAAAEGVEEPV